MTQQFSFSCDVAVVLDEGGDPSALGAAVTVALCGHWEHPPPCLWPHHTHVEARDGVSTVHVRFSCDDDDEAEVRRLIHAGLATGDLKGPHGRRTKWTWAGSRPR